MVLRLKTRESRSLPGLLNATHLLKSQIAAKSRKQKPPSKRLYPILRYSPINSGKSLTRGGAAPADPQKAQAFEDRQNENSGRLLGRRSKLTRGGAAR